MKTEIKIDESHTYVIGRYGPVIKHNDNGTIKFKKIKKDIDIEKLKNGDYTITDLVDEQAQFIGRSLGSYKNKEVILKKGKYGLYMTHDSKNYSLKSIRKNGASIILEDVLDILLGKKSTNPKVSRILNEDVSIRKGKYGLYVYYKTKTMKKPLFYGAKQLFGNDFNASDLSTLSDKTVLKAVSKYL